MASENDDKGMTEIEGSANVRAADKVIMSIEAQIISGELKKDEPLPTERDLMKQFSSSRTVIREAIIGLSNRGLIECKPRFRPIVRKPDYLAALNAVHHIVTPFLTDMEGVKNLYETRILFERTLVRQAALNARKNDINNLREALLANKNAINDSDAFYATDTAFHKQLYMLTGNPVFIAVHQGFVSWLAPQWDKMLRSPDRNLMNYKGHEAIFNAIEERDPDMAEEALINHLNTAWEFVRFSFKDSNTK